MTRIEQIRQRRSELQPEIVRLSAEENITPEDNETLDRHLTEWDQLTAELGPLEAREAKLDAVRNSPVGGVGDGSTINRDVHVTRQTADDIYDLDRNAFWGKDIAEYDSELNGRAMKSVESVRGLDDDNRQRLTLMLERERDGGVKVDEDFGFRGLAEHILRTGSPEYRAAFRKYLRGGDTKLTEAERTSMSLTAGNGGYTLPYLLDPSIILLNSGTANSFRQLATIKSGNQNAWHGVSSAGVTAEWLGEGSEAADGSPTVALITITAYKGSAWIQATQEFYEDGNIDSEIGMLVADAKDRLEGAAFATGNGTSAPQGIVTALGLVTASRISGVSVTGGIQSTGVLNLDDIYAMDNDMAPRYRPNASWVGAKQTFNAIRRLVQGGTNGNTFWTDLGGGLPPQLIGYPVYQSSDMDSTIVSGSTDDVLILGDFRNYFIYDRLGVQVAFEPMVKGAGFRPTGHVGWWAHWRTGAGASAEQAAAFRMLRL